MLTRLAHAVGAAGSVCRYVDVTEPRALIREPAADTAEPDADRLLALFRAVTAFDPVTAAFSGPDDIRHRLGQAPIPPARAIVEVRCAVGLSREQFAGYGLTDLYERIMTDLAAAEGYARIIAEVGVAHPAGLSTEAQEKARRIDADTHRKLQGRSVTAVNAPRNRPSRDMPGSTPWSRVTARPPHHPSVTDDDAG
ncbi:hypothetical protein ABZV91_30990 [Nocardia sp. NPDC004568]|uniref:hypothetical protein n=1 Tax=Nocardia sp. NPDC004568 TaxID=3154551 RepID=UPI0033B0B02F